MAKKGIQIRKEATEILKKEPLTASQLAQKIGVNAERVIRNLYKAKRVHFDGLLYTYLPEKDPRINSLTIHDALDSSEWYPSIFGQSIMHSWAEIAFLEQIMSHYDFTNIVELGTASGGLTTFFILHAIRNNSQLLSIDINKEPATSPYNILKNHCDYMWIRGNAIKPDEYIDKQIREVIQSSGKTLLYCDANGYKEARRDQMKHWVPYMKKGDVVMAHDYPIQITKNQIKKLIEEYNLKPFHEVDAWRLGCRVLTYERT